MMKAILVVCVMASGAEADHHSLPGATFDFAEPWAAQDSPDHTTVIYKADNRFAIVAVFSPHAGTAAASFATDWKQATTTVPTKTTPTPAARKLAGRTVLEGTTDVVAEGSNVTVDVALIEVGAQVVPVLTVTQDRKMLKSFQPDVDKMLASIQVAAPPAPVVETGKARTLTTISVADLAGSWSTHDQVVTGYVNSSTGAYAGTDVSATQEFYDIKADGSYNRRFQGLANGHVVRESNKGTITLSGSDIVFTEGKDVRRMQFLEFAIDADGNAHWKLMMKSYPLTQPNISLYAEKWFRAAAKK